MSEPIEFKNLQTVFRVEKFNADYKDPAICIEVTLTDTVNHMYSFVTKQEVVELRDFLTSIIGD